MKLIAILLESQYKANQKLTQKLVEYYITHDRKIPLPLLNKLSSNREALVQSLTALFTNAMKRFDINPNQERWLLTNILEAEKENTRLNNNKQLFTFAPQEAEPTLDAKELFGYNDNPLADTFTSHIEELFRNFDKYKNALQDKNIFNYNINEFVKAAGTLAKKYHKDSQTTAEKLGFKRHLETPTFIIDIIDKFETIANLPESELKTKLTGLSDSTEIAAPFHNTSWCVKYEANFNNYSKGGPFLLVYQKPGLSKYGLLSTKEFKNPENKSIIIDKNFKKFLEETKNDDMIMQYIIKVYSASQDFDRSNDEVTISILNNIIVDHLNEIISNYKNANYTQRKNIVETLLKFYRKTNHNLALSATKAYSEQIKQMIEKTWLLDSGKVPITALLLKTDANIHNLKILRKDFRKSIEDIESSTNLQDDIRTTIIMIAQGSISDEDVNTILNLLEDPAISDSMQPIIASLPVEIIEKITKRNIYLKSKRATQHILADTIARTHPENTTIALNLIESYAKTHDQKSTIKFINHIYESLIPEIIKTPRFEQLAKTYAYLQVYTETRRTSINYAKMVELVKQGIMPGKEALDALLRESLPLALELSLDYIGPWDDLEEALRESGETKLLNRYLDIYTPF